MFDVHKSKNDTVNIYRCSLSKKKKKKKDKSYGDSCILFLGSLQTLQDILGVSAKQNQYVLFG